MGWMGDAEVFVRTATCNSDVAAFFTKWLVDVDDAQTPDGAYSDISPSYGGGGTPAWADAGVICPWTIYLADADKRILQKHLPNMTRWVEWCRIHSTGLIRDHDRNGDYGDWLAIGSDTPKDIIGTAFFAYSTHLVALSYAAIGDTENAAKYTQLFDEIKAAFNAKYVKPDGRITGNTQCCYAMALKFELLPESLRTAAAQYLQEDIKAKGNHLSTGFVGVSYLLPDLTRAGMADTAYDLLMQDTFPSWLFSVKHGATTIWERWDGWTPDKGFQDPGMNSFNHYSLGSCGEWLFDSAAGIGVDWHDPGYKHVILHPQTSGPLTWVNAHHDSIYGRIESDWARAESGALTLKVRIPANSTATVYVPAADSARVMESGKPADKAEGVKFVRMESGCAVYDVGAGAYQFSVEK
jgi:alpha-L-rhamnosidase